MSDLPSFVRPPVIETVLGAQFEPVPGLLNAHLGKFVASLGQDWKAADEQPPLDSQFEEFPAGWSNAGVQFRLTHNPACRLRIMNEKTSRMVQVQNGRLMLNWLGTGEYPRYSTMKPEFREHQQSFERFLHAEGFSAPKPNQWEMTYVNHIPAGPGELWQAADDWSHVFSWFENDGSGKAGLRTEGTTIQKKFEIQERKGRLYFEVNSAKRDGNGIIVVKVTARGPLPYAGWEGLSEGLDTGYNAIVSGFVEMTSEYAHKHWGRQR